MHQQVSFDSHFDHGVIKMVSSILYAAEGSCGSAASGVQRYSVMVVQLSKAVGAWEGSFKESIKEYFVFERIDTYFSLIVFIQTPANVIMATDVVYKRSMLFHGKDVFRHMFKKPYILAGQGRPEVHHQ